MRPTKEQADQNRKRIIDAAGRLFREKGIHAVGVDEVMKSAGLTHGGFYGHFKSKGDLAAEALSYAMDESLRSEEDFPSVAALAETYLSKAHRDEAENGCTVASLGPELARLPSGKRGVIASYVRKRIDQMETLQEKTGDQADRGKAIADLASLVGALVMARAVDDEALSNEILAETIRIVGNG
ncbi:MULTISPECIES: TetR/AcrR family transcriptional regulator [unclassified Rhizobium]|uniref:TetR/AcrR family transcriptional regulator n=1 Tax=unclassified Rhizobium TaxID=2613769 RepID=UPI00160D444F|nr:MULTISPECIES: TetR/AcrR family transcriptional regulator [unclassified Rhizobium]MBB3541778.1 TetR/AcrR family transcriptional repressor of nem operon [Rhizobium sp. BK399]MCS3740642.1 TetR/AcrR family transcriptional repressor of nem operon [Rhizobium sp. BK661]MCS4092522.1 TetR/AcrR family transcriptional repressor of nem operon [Rhizobium sp. BK176]